MSHLLANPLVSIIVPCYNAEKYVAEAIQSALDQTYPNCEILVIDDGSTDGSLEVIKGFGAQIRWETGPNRGGCAARNRGFELSEGEWIQYLDADDLLDFSKIEIQMKSLTGRTDMIATCPYVSFFGSVPDSVEWDNRSPLIDSTAPLEWLLEKLTAGSCKATMQHCFLTPRAVIERAGPWKEDLRINQDGEFFARVFLTASEIIFTADTQVYYRRGIPKSVSRQRSEQHAKSAIEVCGIYESLLMERQDSQKVRAALRQSYLGFIHEYYPSYPKISMIAETAIQGLGFDSLGECGGPKFRFLCRAFGIKKALRLRSLLNRIVRK